jgi:hypothetical protein
VLLDLLGHWRRHAAERGHQPPPLVRLAHPHIPGTGHRPVPQLRRQERPGAGDADPGGEGRLRWRLRDELAPALEHPGRVLQRVEQVNDERRGPHLVEGELELGHHPEVPATPTQPPVQVRVLRLADVQELAVGGHDLEPGDVVAGQPVASRQPAHPAAECEPADAGMGDVASRGGQAERLRGPVQVAEQRTARHPGATPVGVDAHRAQQRQVYHQAALRHRDAEHAVAAAAHPDLQVPRTGEADRGGDVGRAGAAGDDGRPPVHHRVPDLSGLVVAVLVGQQDLALEAAAERCHVPVARLGTRPFDHRILLLGRAVGTSIACTADSGRRAQDFRASRLRPFDAFVTRSPARGGGAGVAGVRSAAC